MKADIWQTNFGGELKTHCAIVIEEISITSKRDIKRAKELTNENNHNEVRKIALKYTDNNLFRGVVMRLDELNKKSFSKLTEEEQAEHQALVKFAEHFRIIF